MGILFSTPIVCSTILSPDFYDNLDLFIKRQTSKVNSRSWGLITSLSGFKSDRPFIRLIDTDSNFEASRCASDATGIMTL